MKDMVKKNQVMITALAIMIAIAGYLHFAGEVPEDGSLEASADVANQIQIEDQISIEDLTADYDLNSLDDISEEDLAEAAMLDGLDSTVDVVLEDYSEEEMVAVQPEDNEIPGDTVYTASAGIATISEAKLLKEQTRAKNKETLLEIIENTDIADAQKQEAIQNMISMTNIAEMETGAEILLEAKGFEDCIVSISDTGVDVVVNAASLSDVELAQIVDIVNRKTGVNESEIVISTVNAD
ncbi:MAG: SpoIIIAH-like family protein [Lachnospiraceae bacterium]|nr:SpoIIIAH-like family protein [Lachnospiraceae bacterium]